MPHDLSSAASPSEPRRRRQSIHRPIPSIYVVSRREASTRTAASTGKEKRQGGGARVVEADTGGNGATRRAMRRTNGLERDEGEAARRQKHRARTLKGWETRRGSERLSPVIDGADEEWLDESILASDLPSDDLLHALHDHASRFYSSHSLMLARDHRLQPIRGPSAPSLSRYTPAPTPAGSSTARSRRRGSTMMSMDHVSDEGGEEVAEGEENEEAETSVRPRGPQHGVARGPYVKRDMYGALDGTALVALGILVEEHVKRQLDAMGYQRREVVQGDARSEDEMAVDEGDANDSDDND